MKTDLHYTATWLVSVDYNEIARSSSCYLAGSKQLFRAVLFLTLQISVSPQQAGLLAVSRTVAVKILLVSSPELLGGAACSMKHTWYCIYM